MKDLFQRDALILSGFDPKQKKQSLVVSILLIVFFIFAGFTFFNFMYVLCDCIGSIVSGNPDVAIKDLLRSLPIVLSMLLTCFTLTLLQASFRNGEKRLKSLFKDAIVLLSIGGVSILYVFVGLGVGIYDSLVTGSPSTLFPLDSVLFSLFFVAIGILTLLYVKKWEAKAPYLVPSRGPGAQKARGLYTLGMGAWLCVALYGFAAFVLGLFITDFLHGYVFYSVMLLLMYLLPVLYLMVWEFYYNELKVENRSKALFPLSLVGLGVSVLVIALYFVALQLNLDGPSNAGFGILAVDFTASVNAATLIYVSANLLIPLFALIKAIRLKKGAKAKQPIEA